MKHPCLVTLYLSLSSVTLFAQVAPVTAPSTFTDQDTSPGPTLDLPPRPIHIVRPDYPRTWRRSKKHGLVRLHATITTDGLVRDTKVVSGGREIAAAAMGAVQQWRYRPRTVNGMTVEAPHDVAVDFTDDGVFLGPDDLSPGLPMEPSKEVLAILSAGEIRRVGKKVTAPTAINAPDPEYSEAARKARYSGVSVVSAVVGPDGRIQGAWVKRPLGGGLDENALDILKQWTFRPAMENGKPVAVMLDIEFTFRLY